MRRTVLLTTSEYPDVSDVTWRRVLLFVLFFECDHGDQRFTPCCGPVQWHVQLGRRTTIALLSHTLHSINSHDIFENLPSFNSSSIEMSRGRWLQEQLRAGELSSNQVVFIAVRVRAVFEERGFGSSGLLFMILKGQTSLVRNAWHP